MSFNQLSPAQAERLALLAEECGELIQAIGKVLRHGYDSRNPNERNGADNTEAMERECGDVLAAIALLVNADELSAAFIEECKQDKLTRVGKYLHHAMVRS